MEKEGGMGIHLPHEWYHPPPLISYFFVHSSKTACQSTHTLTPWHGYFLSPATPPLCACLSLPCLSGCGGERGTPFLCGMDTYSTLGCRGIAHKLYPGHRHRRGGNGWGRGYRNRTTSHMRWQPCSALTSTTPTTGRGPLLLLFLHFLLLLLGDRLFCILKHLVQGETQV